MKSTIEDVAKLAGVSITTVSRVLNNNYPVKKETRERIENAIKVLNYQPNPLARGLINKRTNSIGVVVPGITNMFFTEVIHGIESYIKSLGYDVLLSNTDGDSKTEIQCVNKFLDRMADGIIILDPQTENIKSGFYDDVTEKIPLICINGFHEKVNANSIISDEDKGSRDAIEYLIKLGHRNIALVRGGQSYSYDIKESIYREYMHKIGSKVMVIDTEDGNSIAVVDNTARKIAGLEGSGYKLGKDITAFFACNDLMAVGILNGCNELGISVPDEVSIIGFDNIILSQMTVPKITTVDQNMKTLGYEAAKSIIELIENKELSFENKYIRTSLVIRESTTFCKQNAELILMEE